LWTVWPLMSMPRMSVARATASSASAASLTPPALPRPPTFTCALTTTRPPRRSAMARASSGWWRRRRPAPAARAGRTDRAPGTRTGPRSVPSCQSDDSYRPQPSQCSGWVTSKGAACGVPHRTRRKLCGGPRNPVDEASLMSMSDPRKSPGDIKDGRCPVGRGVAAGHRARGTGRLRGASGPSLILFKPMSEHRRWLRPRLP